MIESLSLDQLRSFVTIAETGSYTEAAERLYRSQPALSLQIKRLEEQLSTKLFDRSGRVSRLTESGRLLHGYAVRMLELNEEALARLSLVEARGTVRVGVLEEVAHGRLVRLLTRFGRLAAEIRIELEVSTSWELARMIQANDLCLAIANTAYSEIPATPLWTEPYVWAQSVEADFLQERPVPVIIDPVDSPCAGCRAAMTQMGDNGIETDVVFSSISLLATQAAIRAGLGLGIIAESAVTDDMDVLGPETGLPQPLEARIGLYRGTEATGSAAESLHEFLVAHLQQRELAGV
ncbi:MAG: LysR family transcriptional regulator [Rhodothermales bacterium]|nr:LysR family transcriptional regulator [Rhodothermales bacterium]MBO6781514.1 LysR family transcriptional regulator [Rhodothermales bacterium]